VRKLIKIMSGLTLLFFLLGSCSGEEADHQNASNESKLWQASNNDTELPQLSYWSELNGNASSVKARFENVPFFQEWQQRTGVKLTFIQPPANQATEAFNVMIASEQLPDMIEYEWNKFPGGPEKAIKDGVIFRLNEVLEQFAPNLMAYLAKHPELDQEIRTADGSYYFFPFIQADDKLRTYQGPLIRKDWLDELELDVPTTISDWEIVLRAFKEQKGVVAPLTFLGLPSPLFGVENGAFIGAFGIKKGFYIEEGQVMFGPMEEGYKAFLTLFRDWYGEGLIDRNIATVDSKTQDVSMVTGRSGASIWNIGAGIGTWLPYMREENEEVKIVPTPYPVLNKGDRPKFGQYNPAIGASGKVAISAKSDNIEAAVRMLDYGYGPEGHMLFNFGIEGKSYVMKDGYPYYTDLILNNADKLAPSQALAMYTRASYYGPFAQDVRYLEQYYLMPEQQEAFTIWGDTDAILYTLPVTPKTEQENSVLFSIMQNVNTYVDEMSIKFILGIEPIEAFDQYVKQLKTLNIEKAIEIHQTALDR